ncbi:calmodulin-like protein 2 [Solanum stenotomum]|uniref:calmodulin-like protein 2 n=1 Tax=Solanum stenotomum TaxID=172797 RepID=UPI0020D1C928|nr:calmodulin-like protein 2 [Solanum stenotomum]
MLNFIRPSRNNNIKCACSHVHLSDEQLTKVIKKYDSNGNNYLNKEDLKELFRQLGSNAPRWRAARAIHHADKNGDGRIDMTAELDQLVKNIIRCTCGHVPLTEVQLTNIFKKCDFNGDGYLTKEDLTEAFRQLGSTFPGYRAGRALHRADKNGDGLIDKKELDKLVESCLVQVEIDMDAFEFAE